MRIKLAIFLILAGFLTSVVNGAIAKKMSVEYLVKNAIVIVQGKVKSTEAAWDKENKTIWTEVKIEIEKTLKGDAEDTISLYAHGGKVGDKAQDVAGSANFSKDESVIVFGWKDSEDRMQILGMAQGKFKIYFGDDEVEYVKNSLTGITLVDDDGKKLDENEYKPTKLTLKEFLESITKFVAKEKEAAKSE